MGNVTLDDIRAIDRFRQPPDEGLMCEILWSDPHPYPGRAPSKRGVGVAFGPDVTKAFLEKNGLELLVRSHEVKEEGYLIEADGKLITVFSAPNYCFPESDTQVLTSAGFLFYSQLRAAWDSGIIQNGSIKIAAYDSLSNSIVYQTPSRFIDNNPSHHESLVEFASSSSSLLPISLRVTSHHTMLAAADPSRPQEFSKISARDMLASNASVRLLTHAASGAAPSSSPTFSKPTQVTSEDALRAFGADHDTTLPLPSWASCLPLQDARTLLEGLFGSAQDLTTPSPLLRDQIVQIALHAGQSASFTPSASGPGYTLCLVADPQAATPVLAPSNMTMTPTTNGERTWCFTMPAGTLIARRATRGGDAVVTQASPPIILGNCDQVGNKGAFIRFDSDLKPHITSFSAVPHPDVKPIAYAGPSLMSLFGL